MAVASVGPSPRRWHPPGHLRADLWQGQDSGGRQTCSRVRIPIPQGGRGDRACISRRPSTNTTPTAPIFALIRARTSGPCSTGSVPDAAWSRPIPATALHKAHGRISAGWSGPAARRTTRHPAGPWSRWHCQSPADRRAKHTVRRACGSSHGKARGRVIGPLFQHAHRFTGASAPKTSLT
jgi:hypothetical protein